MSLLHVAGLIPAVVSNTISIILVSIISFFKIRNLKLCKKMKINEIQLSKIIFDKQINYSYLKKYYPLFIIGFITLLICVMEALILYWSCPGYRITEAQTDLYH
ncbi:MAG: hypothetical protein MJ195_01170 [Mycoplasmoidaceae bacterium]|nr:hypothetical protein [Mycoplasmoidaceae bacterium]